MAMKIVTPLLLPWFRFTLLLISCFCDIFVSETTHISTTKFLRDPETIVSSNSEFEIGFFSPVNSTNRYLGVWYHKNFDSMDVIWVANKNHPMKDSSGVLRIATNGNHLQLILSNKQNKVFWSSSNNASTHQANHTTTFAQLEDTGNLVLQSIIGNDESSSLILWQSFKDPSNTLLPQMTISSNESVIIRSWKSRWDPSDGRFWGSINPYSKLPEIMIWDGDRAYWRSGPWNGNLFLGIPYVSSSASYGFRFDKDDESNTVNMLYYAANKSLLTNYHLKYDGNVVHRTWDDGANKFLIKWNSIGSECDVHGKCGSFGICNPNDSKNTICSCLKGFVPKKLEQWSRGNWSSGCVRRKPLQCEKNTTTGGGGKEDGFIKISHGKVPDYADYLLTKSQEECRDKCLGNCSCLAYSYPYGIGCMLWSGTLIDLQLLPADGADVFVRLDHSQLDEKTTNLKFVIVAIATVATATMVIFAYYIWRWMRGRNDKKSSEESHSMGYQLDQDDFKEIIMFNFKEMEVATDNFLLKNKLGEGGFGSVYKGIMKNGKEMAVKRLSKASGQGLQEFMNEVLVISKLQHNNLVKLLGCCVEREEKLLVYEFMPNGSLDALLFEPNNRHQLDWIKRYNIINGICRGLLYLHRDSRMKIIHRDLKASNILLDEHLDPKISDFGLAKIFVTKQDQANTARVVGTYGYMSPEYAMEGLFSEKSDIFSLGVLLLEIISGRKNSSFLQYESLSLLTYAWKLWNANNMISLIDPIARESCYEGEIMKCIQIGLLCVQEYLEDRPSISTLISMLDTKDIKDLPQPKQPGFTLKNGSSIQDTQSGTQQDSDVDNVTITILGGR